MFKKLLIIFTVAVLAFSLISCSPKAGGNTQSQAGKPLSDKDFSLTDGKTTITLDSAYKDFKTTEEEEKQQNNLVAENTINGKTYKTYSHKFKDYDLFVSNADYDLKNRKAEDQYITQVNVKTINTFKTPRGISSGSKIDDVITFYGEGKKTAVNGRVNISYQYNGKELLIVADPSGTKVDVITMRVLPVPKIKQ